MKIAYKDVEKRLYTRLDKSIIAADRGVHGVMKFGIKNDYPNLVERLINSSTTAKAVSNMYAKFLSGAGFSDERLNSLIVGKDYRQKSITLLSLLRQVSDSFAKYNGAYIHVNLNLEKKVVNARLEPFKNCRFTKIDDTGYTSKIAVYDNWTKEPDKIKSYNKNDIAYYDIFNLDNAFFTKRIKEVEEIQKYNGQIYFEFFDNEYLYPLSPFDAVYMDLDTEYQVSVFKNNMTRNGMTKKVVLRMQQPSSEDDEEDLREEIKKWQGTDGTNVLTLYDEIDPETGEIKRTGAFAVDNIESSIDDKLFENWQKELTNNIRKAVNGMPAVLIDYEEGKLSTTSGESIIQATNYYNELTRDNRSQISQMFYEIFRNFDNKIISQVTDWSIKPLSLYGTDRNQISNT